MNESDLVDLIPNAAFAFRGYNIENLGRTHELLEHPDYGPVVRKQLRISSEICSDLVSRHVDLVARVVEQRETTLEEYDEAIALVLAVECAQVQCLRELFGVDMTKSRLFMGYSLGEIAALTECGIVSHEGAMSIPLRLATGCIELAHDMKLGVLFSREGSLNINEVKYFCQLINHQGNGVIGISTILSPNSLLLMGQRNTVRQFKDRAKTELSTPANVRINHHRWPPLHTPIVWEKSIPNRAAVLMHSVDVMFDPPTPPVLSMVTGTFAYEGHNVREILHRWVDHPQLLWDVVFEILSLGLETVIHVGPKPNIIPATFRRLSENVELQTRGKLHMRALGRMARTSWLSAMLPQKAALLRAPFVKQIVLEDWLLAAKPSPGQ